VERAGRTVHRIVCVTARTISRRSTAASRARWQISALLCAARGIVLW